MGVTRTRIDISSTVAAILKKVLIGDPVVNGGCEASWGNYVGVEPSGMASQYAERFDNVNKDCANQKGLQTPSLSSELMFEAALHKK